MTNIDENTLLKFIYQTPLGLSKFDDSGEIKLLNAHGVALFYQFFPDQNHTNILRLLESAIDNLPSKIASFDSNSGTIINEVWTKEHKSQNYYLAIRIDRLEPNINMLIIDDITDRKRREHELIAQKQEAAVQTGKLEVASSILHDIGNAVSGISASVAQNLSNDFWHEVSSLEKLSNLFNNQKKSFDEILGPEKAAALLTFVQELHTQVSNRQEKWTKFASFMSVNIEHIQQILAIQRNYVGNFKDSTFHKVNLFYLLQDAYKMSLPLIRTLDIQVSADFNPEEDSHIRGDPTKLMQVFINLIKNSCEAMELSEEKSLKITLKRKEDFAIILISDSGTGLKAGIDPFKLGVSTKEKGSGLGLAFIKSIVESHHGDVSLNNQDSGPGTLVKVILPLESVNE